MSKDIGRRCENTEILAKFCSWKLNLYSASCLCGRKTVVVSSVSSAAFVVACFFLLMPLQNASCRYLWVEGAIQVFELKRRA